MLCLYFVVPRHTEEQPSDFQDPFLNAIRDGDVENVREFLANGSNPNAVVVYCPKPLRNAGYFGHVAVADLLLRSGAILDDTSQDDFTPLQCAVYSRHLELAKFFLAQGADPNASSARHRPALSLAVEKGDLAMVKLLLEGGANPEGTGESGWRPLHVAVRSAGYAEEERASIVTVLLEHGADPNASNPEGPAWESRHDSHVGFRFGTLRNRGITPLEIATSNGFTQTVAVLRQHGAK